jgi:hypothetical protein
VLDKKTGRLDMSEAEFAIQLALYAHLRALRNYSTGSYEPVPANLATDYAIIAHVLVGQGVTKLYRVDIEQGWLWCRLAAEVRSARKTKSVITPWITPDAQPVSTLPSFIPAIPEAPLFHPAGGPSGMVPADPAQAFAPVHPAAVPDFSTPAPAAHVALNTTAVAASIPVPRAVVGDPDDTSGFFADDGAAIPAVPAFTPGAPVAGPGTAAPAEAPAIDPETEAAELAKLTKSELTELAVDLMTRAGVTPDGPGSIKTKQHKPKVAAEIVAFKNSRGLLVALPSKPVRGKAAVAEAKAADTVAFLNADAELRVIQACVSVQSLTALRADWTNAGRWTDAHEQAANTRRAALEQPIRDAVAGEQPLTPLQQLQGATSLQTLERVWQHVTRGGVDLAPWTPELQAAASAKTAELNGAPS